MVLAFQIEVAHIFVVSPNQRRLHFFSIFAALWRENQAFEVWNVKNSFFQLWREFMKGQKAFCHKNNLAKVHFFIKEQQILPGFVRRLVFSSKKIGQINKSDIV